MVGMRQSNLHRARRSGSAVVLAIAVLAACGLASPRAADRANADDRNADDGNTDGRIVIELNNVAQHGAACRLSLLFANNLGKAIDQLALELVLFGSDGRVVALLATNAGAFPAGKSRLKQFDLRDRSCDSIGRILLNDVTECEGDGLTPASCTAAARPSSRVDIPLSY